MEKEYTYFIIDCCPSMALNTNGRSISDLEFGLQYLEQVLAQKVVRLKKTDQVTVVAYHHASTNNLLQDSGSAEKICVVEPMKPVTYHTLAHCRDQLRVNYDPIEENEGDMVKLLLVALAMALDQVKGAKKGVVNFIVISNNRTGFETDDDLGSNFAKILLNCNNAHIYFLSVGASTGPELDDDIRRENELYLRQFCRQINNGSCIVNFEDLLLMVWDLDKAIPRLVRPVKVFDGELRLGCDLNEIESLHYNGTLGQPHHNDPLSFCINVEGYPFIKRESVLATKTFKLDPGSSQLHPVKLLKNYTVEDSDSDSGQRSVSIVETVNVFKYGTSVIPMNDTLSKVAKLRTYEGIDFRGLMKLHDLPLCYLTEESIMIVNKSNGGKKDLVAFNSLAELLLKLESVAIVRYVLKRNAEVNMGALIPLIVNSDKLQQTKDKRHLDSSAPNDTAYCFSLVRLPFKEDERITNFNRLDRIVQSEAERRKFGEHVPDRAMVDAMVEYVTAMDLDDLEPLDEFKYLTPNEYDSALPLPQNLRHAEAQINSGRINEITAKLMHPAPLVHIVQGVLRQILVQAAKSGLDSVTEYVLGNKELVDSVIEQYNKDLDISIAQPDKQALLGAGDIVERLKELLDNQYEEPKAGRRKVEVDEMEMNNEEDVDIDQLFAGGRR